MGEKEQIKLPRGITVRQHKTGSTIVITFTYRGTLCREPLSRLDVNPKNIKYAERLLGEIQNGIEKGTFLYLTYFPNSKKLALFGEVARDRTIEEYLSEYLIICGNRGLSPSTIDGYKKCKNSLKSLHKLPVTDLTPAILKAWIQKQTSTLKTIRNHLSFLRSAIDEAVTDGLIPVNPTNLITPSRYQSERGKKESDYVIDPLAPDEIAALYSAAGNAQWENLFRFAIHTGLRSSELCALKWSDIDFVGRTAHVNAARVVGVVKGTKTKAGKRKVTLDDEAISALLAQKAYTFMKDVEIFEDPKTSAPWAGASAIRDKAWVPTLRKAGIRYRNPYQTRHTFATRHISQGANLFWLAQQMGHKGPEMLFRHYGSYLEAYDGNTARQFNSKTGN